MVYLWRWTHRELPPNSSVSLRCKAPHFNVCQLIVLAIWPAALLSISPLCFKLLRAAFLIENNTKVSLRATCRAPNSRKTVSRIAGEHKDQNRAKTRVNTTLIFETVQPPPKKKTANDQTKWPSPVADLGIRSENAYKCQSGEQSQNNRFCHPMWSTFSRLTNLSTSQWA